MELWTRHLPGAAQLDGPGNERGLRRDLSVLQLTMLGMGATNGAGIFVMTGAVAAQNAEPAMALSLPRIFRVPVVLFVGIGICMYLIASLPAGTWIRLGVWLLVGLVIDFLYDMRHARDCSAHEAREGANS